MPSQSNVVVLGATGMLGHAVVRVLAEDSALNVIAASRSANPLAADDSVRARFVINLNVESLQGLRSFIDEEDADIVINCIGVVKQLSSSKEVLSTVPLNTLLPHQLAELCGARGARLVHVSTDCVFTGAQGGYREQDAPDARDLYGISKWLGEVDAPHAITLRTSIIGPELRGKLSLLEWFLAQTGPIKGYRRMIFSGLPTAELARVIRDHVIPRPDLQGLYHVSAEPISKLDLLRLFAAEYGHDIEIVPDDALAIDRSLDSTRFREVTGYRPAQWPDLVAMMNRFG